MRTTHFLQQRIKTLRGCPRHGRSTCALQKRICLAGTPPFLPQIKRGQGPTKHGEFIPRHPGKAWDSCCAPVKFNHKSRQKQHRSPEAAEEGQGEKQEEEETFRLLLNCR